MKTSTDKQKIKQLLEKGVSEVIVKKDLEEKLLSGKQLKIKLGIDPSGSDLHLGHMVVIRKLREFQELGHHIQLLFGNFTGQIGDPTGKSETRAPKTQAELEVNARHYLEQVKVLLDINNVEVVWNADWLAKLNFGDIISLASNFTVMQMLERDMFQERIKNSQPISMHEFFYPLMQGYDSVALKSDVELGGTDQTFNLLAGRTLQKSYNQTPQNIITMPILEGTDGVKKMGKSENNFIALADTPKDMYGKTMSIPDELICKYFELATDTKTSEINEYKKAMESGENPMNFKKMLAAKIVEIFHGKPQSIKAAEEFTNIFKNQGLPDEIPTFQSPEKSIQIIELIFQSGLAASKSEARRSVEGGAVKLNGEKISSIDQVIDLSEKKLLQIGKRKFLFVEA
jgi:tyrosyl-tRNA synthetase